MTTYTDENGHYPIRDIAHAVRVGRAIGEVERWVGVEAVKAVLGPDDVVMSCAFVVEFRSAPTITVVVH